MTDIEERNDALGIIQVGELETRQQREARVAENYEEAVRSGARGAYEETALWVEQRIAASGPYDDLRALQDLQVRIADKIREVHAIATNGTHSG